MKLENINDVLKENMSKDCRIYYLASCILDCDEYSNLYESCSNYDEFEKRVLNEECCLNVIYSYISLYGKDRRNHWYRIRELFGDHCFKTASDVGSLLVGNEELFDDKLVTVSAHAPKKFRNNIVHDLQMTSENIVKSIFWANEYRQSDIQKCLKYTKQAEINIRWMTRRLERARRMQCITSVEELDLGGQLATVEEYFAGWSDSNKKLSEELRQEELRKEDLRKEDFRKKNL